MSETKTNELKTIIYNEETNTYLHRQKSVKYIRTDYLNVYLEKDEEMSRPNAPVFRGKINKEYVLSCIPHNAKRDYLESDNNPNGIQYRLNGFDWQGTLGNLQGTVNGEERNTNTGIFKNYHLDMSNYNNAVNTLVRDMGGSWAIVITAESQKNEDPMIEITVSSGGVEDDVNLTMLNVAFNLEIEADFFIPIEVEGHPKSSVSVVQKTVEIKNGPAPNAGTREVTIPVVVTKETK